MFKKLLTYSILSLVGMMGFLGVFIENNNIWAWDSHYIVSIWEETFADDCSWPNPPTPCLSAGNAQNAEMQKMLNSLVGGLNIILDILTIIVSPAIMLASWLMSPDWTSGDLFGIRPALHSLWVTVSNVVYFIYAILLIFIALATIFNSQNYGYKQLLPKLALWVILVPLTWWFVQFTISLSTYITASVISIPMETLAKYSQPGSFWNTESIPKKIIYENSKVLNEDSKEIDKDTVLCEKGKGKCISPETFIKTSWWMYSPLLVYSFSVFKFHEVKKLKSWSDVVYAIWDIIHQGIIGVIMFIVYGLLVIALIFMLLMRAVKLWFYAIFSPLFTIKYVLGDKWFWDADKDGSFKITEFIGLAFVPAVVSLALSFGLIIISVMHAGWTNSGSASSNSKCEWEKCTLTIMGTNSIVSTTTGEWTNKKSVTTVNIGGDKDENRISYEFKGSVQWWEPILWSVTSALWSTGNLFGTIILDIIALIFIWIAFMAGKWVSKAAGKAIEPFEQMGNKLGSLGASLPKYAPIPGIGMSASSLSKAPTMIESGIQKRHDAEFEKSEVWSKLMRFSGASNSQDRSKMTEANNAHSNKEAAEKWVKTATEMVAAQKWQEIHNKTNLDQLQALKDKKISQEEWHKYGGLDNADAKLLAEKLEGSLGDDDRKIIAALLAKKWKGTWSMNSSDAERLLKEGGSASASGSNGQWSNINITINANGKYTLKGSWFDIDKADKWTILTTLNSSPWKLKWLTDDQISKPLEEIFGKDASEIKDLLKKVKEEREKDSKK